MKGLRNIFLLFLMLISGYFQSIYQIFEGLEYFYCICFLLNSKNKKFYHLLKIVSQRFQLEKRIIVKRLPHEKVNDKSTNIFL